MRNVKVRQSLS